MATYVNNLRLTELATGEGSGTWGTTTNTNLELIGQALGFGTRAIANASTDNITIADGASDADRAMYLKLTGGGQACTVTILPNTTSKVWWMENATSYTLTFTCGSGANVAVLAGETKCISTDGLGSGGAVYDVLTDVNLAGTTKVDDLVVGDALTVGGTLGVTGVLTATSLDISGDVDIDGTTNLDVVDIDGAVDMASTLAVGGVVTANAGVVVDNFTLDGTTLALSSGDLTLDVAGDIILDADGGDIFFKNGGIAHGNFLLSGTDFTIGSSQNNGDLIFRGIDGGADITALTLDMSEAGEATFNGDIRLNDSKAARFGTDQDFRISFDGTNAVLQNVTSDSDITFLGNDGGSTITAFSLDMSAEGAATFSSTIAATVATLGTSSVGTDNTAPAALILRHESDQTSGFDDNFGVGMKFNADASNGGYATHAELSATQKSTGYQLRFKVGGTERLNLDSTGGFVTTPAAAGHAVFNEDGVDADFRVESDTLTHALFVEGSSGNVGINNSAPYSPLSVTTTGTLPEGQTWSSSVNMLTLNGDRPRAGFSTVATTGGNAYDGDMLFYTMYYPGTGDYTWYERMRLTSKGALITTPVAAGHAVFNEGGVDADFRVESDGNANMLFVDGGNNRVGIGTGSPTGDVQIVTATAGTVFNVNHDTGGSYPKASGIGLGATSTAYTVSSDGGTVAFTGGAGIYAENTAASGNPTNLVFWTNLLGSPAEAMRLAGSGAATFSSTIALGDSKQIFFGADSDGRISFDGTDTLNITASNGSATTVNVTANNFKIGGASRLISGTANDSVVINEDSADIDFRVESDGNANALFVDGGANHIGMGTATLNRSGLGADHIVLTVGADTEMGMLELQGTRTSDADLGRISFLNAGTRRAEIVAARIDADNSTKLYFQTSNAGSLGTRLTIGKDGAATFNSSVLGSIINAGVSSSVGIGTATADANVAELGSGYLNLGRDDTADAAQIAFSKNGVLHSSIVTDNNDLRIKGNTSNLGIRFDGSDNGSNITALRLDISAAGAATFNSSVVVNESGADADFRVESDTNTHALFVDAGNSYVNLNSSATPDASVAGFMFTSDQLYTSAGAATTLNYQVRFYNGNGLVGSITTDGSATAYLTSSDQRLKENIADADDAGSKIDAIQVRKFDWKVDGSHQDYGMIAQELLEIAPEAVSQPEDPEEMMGVDYSKLVPMMLKEIQSLRARVADLES
jgi:cytoskeletal protein CcmA (bactofilin family)